MNRYAVFLDAGYFFSAGANVIEGRKVPRKRISLRVPTEAVSALCDVASGLCDSMPLLRIYWYDAMPGSRPSLEQSTLALLPRVKLRLGVLNNVGEQKGVDSLIVTDLIELARNRAIMDAVIVSGDEDLRVAVQVAQSFGVRVHLLAAGDPKNNVSASLQMEADSIGSLTKEWFTQQLAIAVEPALAPQVIDAGAKAAAVTVSEVVPESLDNAAASVGADLLSKLSPDALAALKQHFSKSNSVPPEFDRPLIARAAQSLGGRNLSGEQMRRIRGVFVTKARAS